MARTRRHSSTTAPTTSTSTTGSKNPSTRARSRAASRSTTPSVTASSRADRVTRTATALARVDATAAAAPASPAVALEAPRSAPEELFESLLAAATDARKRNSLMAVRRALDMMRETKAREYTIAAVARGLAALGYAGPKAQSMRNAEGKDFKTLIAAYAAEYQAPPGPRRVSDDDDLVASIADHRAAARVQWVLNQNQSLQRRLDILHAQFKQLAAIELVPEGVGARVSASRPQFTEMEVKAVRKFVASIGDLECSFDDETGALLHDRHGLEIGPPGLHQALQKVLSEGGST